MPGGDQTIQALFQAMIQRATPVVVPLQRDPIGGSDTRLCLIRRPNATYRPAETGHASAGETVQHGLEVLTILDQLL